MNNFNVLKAAIASHFAKMQKHQLFRVEVDKDELWNAYLGAFPPGSDPIFKKKSGHDCSCCKQFIRTIGDVVAIIGGEVVSIWDVSVPDEPNYQAVVNALAALVKSKPIVDVFLHYEKTVGTDKNFEQLTSGVQTWTHFFVNVGSAHIADKKAIPTKLGEARTTRDVFTRSITEISNDAVETVLDLIAQGSLYRGEEHKHAVETFKAIKAQYDSQPSDVAKMLFTWTTGPAASGPVARMRNTVTGTLLQDLSNGVEIDRAVASFESKVAPTNYKRPTALITKGMIDKAKTKLAELGLTSALERRHATLSDVTINNVIFADRNAKKAIGGDIFDDLSATAATKVKNLDKIEEVPIDRFISDIVPRADSIEVMVENRLAGNLVSLIAPIDPTAGSLFKWPNNFSWSYAGEMADSIKDKVKKAGGDVAGDLCCRLAWWNYDDLDFHMLEPNGGHICFSSKRGHGGALDVDMNAGGHRSRQPVENIVYPDRRKMREGNYTLFVRQFSQRELTDVGFEVEIDYLGTVNKFTYDKVVKGDVIVARLRYTHAGGLEIVESLPSSQVSKTTWGLQTQSFHRVSTLMMSPNYWDGSAVGNKHYLFMIDGCKNDGSARGFFNEFLKADLDQHRKVLEIVSSKMKIESSPDQLSGLGFSSTQRNTLVCRVKGSFSRTVKVKF